MSVSGLPIERTTAFLTGAFLTGAFLTGAFLAGAAFFTTFLTTFLAGAFLATTFFTGAAFFTTFFTGDLATFLGAAFTPPPPKASEVATKHARISRHRTME